MAPLYSQQYIHGKILTTTGKQVNNALVKFIDVSDSSKQFSVLTDSLGDYKILITSIKDNLYEKTSRADEFEVMQNYPNPFSSETKIEFTAKINIPITVVIYDILGRRVKNLISDRNNYERMHAVLWDGTDNNNQKVAYGIYLYKITGTNSNYTKKMVYLSQQNIGFPLHGSSGNSQRSSFKNRTKSLNALSKAYNVYVTNTDSTTPRILQSNYANLIVNSDSAMSLLVKETLPKDAFINDIAFVDTLVGWLVTWSPGNVFKTEDGGITWFGLKLPSNANLYSLSPINKDSLFVVGDSILFSSDGGSSWQQQHRPTSFSLSDVKFTTRLEGWAVGGTIPMTGQKSNVILHTMNAGVKWEVSYSSDEGSLSGVSFVGTNGWAVGNTSFDNAGVPLILFTSNSGATWSRQSTPSQIQAPLSKVQFYDSLTGYAVGYAGVLKTTNGGNEWIQVYQNFGPPFWNLFLLEKQELWVNRGINILKSLDGGLTWQTEWQRNVNDHSTLVSMYFTSNKLGWAAGPFATILKYQNGEWKNLSPQ